MRYYDELATYEREGYTVIVDKSWEDLSPRDSFDESCCDIEEIIKDIERGHLEWFMLRVRVLVEGLELSSEYLGGMLYEDPKECLTDGSAEDLIDAALADAKKQVYRLSRVFTELSYAADAEGVAA
jgi:hypothetical protein